MISHQPTKFQDLSVDLLYEIFEYFSMDSLFHCFYDIYPHILVDPHLPLRVTLTYKNIDKFLHLYLPNINPYQIIFLYIDCSINLPPSFDQFVNLRSLVFIQPKLLYSDALTITGQFRHLTRLEHLRIDSLIDEPREHEKKDVCQFVSEMVRGTFKYLTHLRSFTWRARFLQLSVSFDPTLLSTLCTNNSIQRFNIGHNGWTWDGLFQVVRRLPNVQYICLPLRHDCSLRSISSTIDFTLPHLTYAVIGISDQQCLSDMRRLIVQVMPQLKVLTLKGYIDLGHTISAFQMNVYFEASTWKQFMKDIHTLRTIKLYFDFKISVIAHCYPKYRSEMEALGFFRQRSGIRGTYVRQVEDEM
jgi:hypothetical protein